MAESARVLEMQTWLSLEEAVAATDWHERHVRRMAESQKIVSRPSGSHGRNSKPRREYLLSSLPAEAQVRYANQQAAKTLVTTRPPEPAALDATSQQELAFPRAVVPDHLRRQADERFAVIEQLLEYRRKPRAFVVNGRVVENLNGFVEWIAGQQAEPVSARTVYRWLARFDEFGYAALADAPRSDKGQSRFFAEHPAAALFVQNKVLGRDRLRNARLVHDALRREWATLSIKGEAPSYATVRAYIDTIPRPVATLAHEGPEALHAKHSPFILRKAPPAMVVWNADHRVFDVRIRNTMFPHLADDQAFRLWMTAVYDWGSRYLVGYCFAPTPSSDTINSALRMALSRFGFPKNFYWDNGKDFKSVGAKLEEIKASESMRHLLLQHRIDFGLTSALPKHPRSKPIEAYFTRWSKRFDVLWQSAYRGNRPSNRPEAAAVADREHQKYLAGKRPDSPLPSDRDFILCADQWISEYNGDTRLESLDGRTPQEVLDEQAPVEQRKPAPNRILDALLMKDDVRTVLAGGCVEICRMRYEPKPEFIGPMFLAQGKKVTILRDPYHFEEAVAVDPDTHEFIAELALLLPVDQVPNGQYTNDHLKTKLRTQRALERSCRDYIAAVSAGASMHGWQTEVEALRGRALTRAGDSLALPAAPGAVAEPAERPRAKFVPESPFVDDAAAKCIAAMSEEGAGE